ncbi:MAG: glycosyltransferase [Acetanaerobacterium sp.]
MILFVCYTDIKNASSGSSVRPQRMYEAFTSLGFEVLLLCGAQEDHEQRRRAVRRVVAALKRKTPRFCYIELPSGPIAGAEDRKLLLHLRRLGVPCAAFYRDAFYRFAPWWGVSAPKKAVLRFLHTVDNFLLARCCDIVYFPSKSMAALFSFRRTGVLPPACEALFFKPRETPRTCIYVGGLSPRYGTDLLLNAFEQLNRTGSFPLTIVCREKEVGQIDARRLAMPWLTVAHASGEALEQYYARADIGLYCGRRDVYMDFAMPVKVFEYLSHGLVVVTTNCIEIASFVHKNGVGRVVGDNARSIAAGVRELVARPKSYRDYYNNIVKTVKGENLWIHRAQQVANDLLTDADAK